MRPSLPWSTRKHDRRRTVASTLGQGAPLTIVTVTDARFAVFPAASRAIAVNAVIAVGRARGVPRHGIGATVSSPRSRRHPPGTARRRRRCCPMPKPTRSLPFPRPSRRRWRRDGDGRYVVSGTGGVTVTLTPPDGASRFPEPSVARLRNTARPCATASMATSTLSYPRRCSTRFRHLSTLRPLSPSRRPRRAAVPVMVTGAPLGSDAPCAGEEIDDIGACASGVPGTRPGCRLARAAPPCRRTDSRSPAASRDRRGHCRGRGRRPAPTPTAPCPRQRPTRRCCVDRGSGCVWRCRCRRSIRCPAASGRR